MNYFPNHIIIVHDVTHKSIVTNVVDEYQHGDDPGIEIDTSSNFATYILFGTGFDIALRKECFARLIAKGIPEDRIEQFDNVKGG